MTTDIIKFVKTQMTPNPNAPLNQGGSNPPMTLSQAAASTYVTNSK